MEIGNSAEVLKAFLGVSSSQSAKSPAVRGSEADGAHTAFQGDQATLSGLGAAMQSAVEHDGVRLDRVDVSGLIIELSMLDASDI